MWVDYKPINVEMDDDKYLLLTEFEVRTVTGNIYYISEVNLARGQGN